MEGGVAVVVEIGVLEMFRVVFDYALDEGEVVEVDGTAKADGDWDHGPCVEAVNEKGFIFGFCRCEYGATLSCPQLSLFVANGELYC